MARSPAKDIYASTSTCGCHRWRFLSHNDAGSRISHETVESDSPILHFRHRMRSIVPTFLYYSDELRKQTKRNQLLHRTILFYTHLFTYNTSKTSRAPHKKYILFHLSLGTARRWLRVTILPVLVLHVGVTKTMCHSLLLLAGAVVATVALVAVHSQLAHFAE